jgi:hypothetical protein
MTDEPTGGTSDSAAELRDALDDLAESTGWHVWAGFGVLYARWPKSTPPVVVRAATPQDLRTKITDARRSTQ